MNNKEHNLFRIQTALDTLRELNHEIENPYGDDVTNILHRCIDEYEDLKSFIESDDYEEDES